MKHFLKMPPKKICLAMVGVLLSFCGIQAAVPAPRTISFRETEGGVEKTAWYVINRNQTGYSISITTNKGNEQILEELHCDSAWRTSWWHYRSAGSSTDLTAKRSGDSIGLSGFLRGKPVTKTLCIDGSPWYQLVTMAMQTIAADSAIKARYWAVSIEGLAVLKAVPFRVATIIDTPLPGHPEIVCRRVQARLDGIFGRFWDGYYFVRSDNGSFVHYEGYRLGSKGTYGTIDIMK
jgi:hypothetical protein